MRRQILGAVVGLCAGLVIVLLVVVIISIRTTQLEGTPLGKKLLASSDRVLDCTEPTGQCYKDSQAQTAKAVGDINRVVILASACSIGLDPKMPVVARQNVIQACVIERLAEPPKP